MMIDEIQSDLDEAESGVVNLSSYVSDATSCETIEDLIANLTEALEEVNSIRATLSFALVMAKKVK